MSDYSKLSPFLRTPADRNRVVSVVKDYADARFKVGHLSQVDDDELQAIIAAIVSGDAQHEPAQLLRFLSSLPIVRLRLAYEPTTEQLTELTELIQQDGQPHRLIEITVDPAIIGGVELSIGGRVSDKTLKSKLTAFFATTDYKNLVSSILHPR